MSKVRHKIKEILSILPKNYEIIGNRDLMFNSIDSIFEAKEGSLSWIRSDVPNIETLVNSTKATVIVCDKSVHINEDLFSSKCFLRVEKPELAFLKIVKHLYRNDSGRVQFFHPTALIHPEAVIGPNVYIGEYCVIKKCTVGQGSVIESYSKIYDNVNIGENVKIYDHCNIGGQGFGFELNESNVQENMLHIGRVDIGNNVEIFPFCNVDRATLSVTKIGNNTKIDHYCHIGHNTNIGMNTLITAKTTLCGGSMVGDNTFIGVGTIVRDKILVGNNVFIGMGSIVTKNIPDGEIWAGNPARPIDELKRLNNKLKNL
jgi:UDP-3-O-[3-hydroxymyristoyl] glucosamine N-acyltransferase